MYPGIIRFSNCCYTIVSGNKRDVLFWIGFLLLLNLKVLAYAGINHNGNEAV